MSAGSSQSPLEDDAVPRLAEGCDPARLELTPAEGFLLSRIDGTTPIRLLRQMGGLPADAVTRCLERWVAEGVVQVEREASAQPPPASAKPLRRPPAPRGPRPASRAKAAPSAATDGATSVDDSRLDPELEMPLETQRRLLGFEARIERPYHEILGVDRDADGRVIKKAYFKLSREFHPDRYFRCRLGPLEEPLGRVWRRILEAYELLSDPQTRAEVQRNEAEAAAASSSDAAPAGGPDLRMLRAHMRMFGKKARPTSNPERARKARAFYEAGMAAFQSGRFVEAAGSVRLAVAFDPYNPEYKKGFAEVQQRAHEAKALGYLERAGEAYDKGQYRDALRIYEDALHYRPFDAALNHRLGWLAWKLGEEPKRAREFAQAACELDPECGEYHRTLGCILKAAGASGEAKRILQRALQLDPGDRAAKQELLSL